MAQGFTSDTLLKRRHHLTLGASGNLAVATGVSRLPVTFDGTILTCRAMVNTAPTGATAIFDVHKNGTTVFTTQANRPTVAISGTDSGAAVPDVTSVVSGDYLTVDIDQIGSSVAGADWTLLTHIERDIGSTNDILYYVASTSGAISVATGALRFIVPTAGQLNVVRAMCNTAPTGASMIMDINVNGTSIYPTSTKPTIAISGVDSGISNPDSPSVAVGDYVTVDVDQVGSTVAGSDLTVAWEIRVL